jgi:cystathionine beta-synthase
VVLLPDGGRGYLSKIFNDSWLRSYGFSPARESHTVADVLATKADRTAVLHVHPTDTVREAIDRMTRHGVSQLLVLRAEPPVVLGEVTGALHENDLLEAVFSGKVELSDEISALTGPLLELIGVNEPVGALRTALTTTGALLVTDGGKVLGVVTRSDLLEYLAT